MPYSKQTWVDNNLSYPVSAARMGAIENGIEAAAIVADIGHRSLTTTQRNALGVVTTGTMIYNSTTQKIETYFAGAWVDSVTNQTAGGSLAGTYPNPSFAANEAWRVVGAAGQPAFQNSWANYGSGYTGARFKKDKENTVFVEGLVASGATGVPIFNLPVGYRVTGGNVLFATQTNANTIGRLELNTSGDIYMASGSNAWFSVCCSFKAE